MGGMKENYKNRRVAGASSLTGSPIRRFCEFHSYLIWLGSCSKGAFLAPQDRLGQFVNLFFLTWCDFIGMYKPPKVQRKKKKFKEREKMALETRDSSFFS